MDEASSRRRLDPLDWLRGLVMALMALDHVRDYVGPTAMSPELLPDVSLAWFMTRWITHFCAPVFVFLAGTSAWLYGSRGRSTAQLSRFLLTRGLWLIFLEITLISCAWTFSGPISSVILLQVIFAIGASMTLLAGLVWLPRRAIAVIGVAILLGHNLMDATSIDARVASLDFRQFATGTDLVYAVLRRGMTLTGFGNQSIFVVYPILPWAAIMLLGFSFGPVIQDPARRARACIRVGLTMTAGFVVLRVIGVYGDPRHFHMDGGAVRSLVSFLNTTKYPPSLEYTLMTLGPALLLLGLLFQRPTPRGSSWLVTLGRVPFFFYLLHIPLANAAGALWFQLTSNVDRWHLALLSGPPPDPYEPRLLPVYAIWFLIIVLLYPACAAYARFRRTARGWWWSYL